jgi:hypothetical protein
VGAWVHAGLHCVPRYCDGRVGCHIIILACANALLLGVLVLCAVAATNLDGISYWGSELSFVDVAKLGSELVPHEYTSFVWDTGVPVAVNADGYITSLATNQRVGTMHLRDLMAHGVSGTYVVLYDGDGVVTPSMTECVGLGGGGHGLAAVCHLFYACVCVFDFARAFPALVWAALRESVCVFRSLLPWLAAA